MFKIVFLVCQAFNGVCYTVEADGYATEAQCRETAEQVISINEQLETLKKKIPEDAVYMCVKSGEPA